jgi:hypothetical protein
MVVDGAARDRLVFTGELGVAAETSLCTNDDLPYLTGGIELFSWDQSPEGAIATAIPAQANPCATPGDALALCPRKPLPIREG